VTKAVLSGRPRHLLQVLYEQGNPATTYTVSVKQSELAEQFGISRQALNVHLRKLRNHGCVRTGRGFIDVTEKGLNLLGVSVNPAFVFIKVSPLRRGETYRKLKGFPIQRIFRVAGDMDMMLIVERDKLDDALQKVASLDGVQDTKSYITIQTVK
jgi:DNA-binding Lrp family transcriptional regulator